MALLKPGDFVIMQFGHNDAGPINDNVRARGTIKGTGEETEEIDNILTGKHEVVHTYGWYLRKFIADTLAKGATPIVCSPVPRKIWRDGKIMSNAEDYGRWSAQVAESAGVRFIPLNTIVSRKYEELGPEKVEELFSGDNTHTSLAGAELNAASVIAGLKALKNNPLARLLLRARQERGESKARLEIFNRRVATEGHPYKRAMEVCHAEVSGGVAPVATRGCPEYSSKNDLYAEDYSVVICRFSITPEKVGLR